MDKTFSTTLQDLLLPFEGLLNERQRKAECTILILNLKLFDYLYMNLIPIFSISEITL